MQRIGMSAADLDGAVSLMIRQARAQRQLFRFSDALTTLDKAMALMRDYEVDPAQRALLFDVQADALSASARFRKADRAFKEVSRLKDQLNHTGTPQNNRHLARRVEHELRQGHAERAGALLEDLKVKDPGPCKSTLRHMELLLLKGELALLRQAARGPKRSRAKRWHATTCSPSRPWFGTTKRARWNSWPRSRATFVAQPPRNCLTKPGCCGRPCRALKLLPERCWLSIIVFAVVPTCSGFKAS